MDENDLKYEKNCQIIIKNWGKKCKKLVKKIIKNP